MQRNVPAIAVALALAAGCSSDPGDAWLGVYEVTVLETIRACDGSASEEGTTVTTWRVERDRDGVFVAGTCRLPLDVRTDSYAVFVTPTTCNGTTSDGRPYTLTLTSGSLYLDGDFISGDQGYRATVDGACVTGSASISGFR